MTRTNKLSQIALLFLPILVVVAVFIGSAEWLKVTFGSLAVTILSGVFSVAVMGYAIYLSARFQRRLDEVQQAGAGFAAKWGPSLGHFAFVLLLLLPPVANGLTDLVNDVAADPGETVDRTVVQFALVLGFMGTVMLQLLGTIVMNAVWWTRRR